MTFRDKYKAEQAFPVSPELLERTAAQMRAAQNGEPTPLPTPPENNLPSGEGKKEARTRFSCKRYILPVAAAACLLVFAGTGYYNVVLRGASADRSLDPKAPQANYSAALNDSAEIGDPAPEDDSCKTAEDRQELPGAESVSAADLPAIELALTALDAEQEAVVVADLIETTGSDSFPITPDGSNATEALPVYQNSGRATAEGIAGEKGETPAQDEIGVYPLRTLAEAKEALLRGEYLTTIPVSYGCEISDTTIRSVKLTYYGDSTSEYIQPVYAFYVEIDPGIAAQNDLSWQGETVYACYWVPAVKSEYVTIVE